MTRHSTTQVVSIRGTNFEATGAEGGSAAVESLTVPELPKSQSSFVGQELSKSDRPELSGAKVWPSLTLLCKNRDSICIMHASHPYN